MIKIPCKACGKDLEISSYTDNIECSNCQTKLDYYSVYNEDDKKTQQYIDENFVIYNGDTIKSYIGNNDIVIVPYGIKIIGYGAFSYNRVKKVILPDTVEYIDETAFLCCKKLEDILFPDNLRYISYYAFSDCSKLKKVEFGINSKLERFDAKVFQNCKSLKNVVLPNTQIKFDKSVFKGCVKLKKVDILNQGQ